MAEHRQPTGARDGAATTEAVARVLARIGVLAAALGALCLVLVLRTNSLAVAGLALVNVGVPVLAFGYALRDVARPADSPLRRLGAVALALVIGAGAGTLAWGLSGVAVRQIAPADHVGRYGQRAEVTVTGADCRHGAVWPRGPRADFYCDGATWRADDRDQRGRLTLFYQEIQPSTGARRIDSYVLGNEAYSVERVGEVESWAWWAGRPLSLLLGLPVLLAGVAALRRTIRHQRTSPARAR